MSSREDRRTAADVDLAAVERDRLAAESRREPGADWKRWGPYLAERQWGTVRECRVDDGSPWTSFPHDHARSRAYHWGEDGLLGLTDRQCRLCFGLALWNGLDPILKERLFGLGGVEGNHGEDVKECYFYLDATPTHSYLKGLYKYPMAAFPYDWLHDENGKRSRHDPEFELTDTGVFDEDRYFDVSIEYAKAAPEDILIRVTVANRSAESAKLHLLPTLWFRNTWTAPIADEAAWGKPRIERLPSGEVRATHDTLGKLRLFAGESPAGEAPEWLFTENETNTWRLTGKRGNRPSCKDAFHLAIVEGASGALNLRPKGTKAAATYVLDVPAQGEVTVDLRLVAEAIVPVEPFGPEFERQLEQRRAETDAYHASLAPPDLRDDERRVLRQAHAGLIWSKQFYCYSVADAGTMPANVLPTPRVVLADEGVPRRNEDWRHLFNRDVNSMPDKWEYPWYAAWDSAFHMIPFSHLDPHFAKEQLLLFLREWYMHPNGQIPAYEWNFGDVNPPVHAWACWRTYQLTGPPGHRDRTFLARCFQKLLLNFTWWVNRKDVRGQHVFSGGFLGLDNIGIFDRSRPLPVGEHLEQADGTAWMAYYCSSMLSIALELAEDDPAYEDMASKFLEHYVAIAEAMNTADGGGLWDEEDGFHYDHLRFDDHSVPLRVRSMVGIIPLFTVDVLSEDVIERLPGFRKRLTWFLSRSRALASRMSLLETNSEGCGTEGLRLLAIPTKRRLERILRYVLNEDEFLSPFGVRSLSRYHLELPFVFEAGGDELRVQYVPGESDSWMFGGNSNWRGPVWFPLNHLLIEAFERYHEFYGDDFRVECPTGSGNFMNMQQVADEIRRRLVRLFLSDEHGIRPCYSRGERFADDPHWNDLVLFYEYFHGDTGRGLGANHQTGWTALVAPILRTLAERRAESTGDVRRNGKADAATALLAAAR